MLYETPTRKAHQRVRGLGGVKLTKWWASIAGYEMKWKVGVYPYILPFHFPTSDQSKFFTFLYKNLSKSKLVAKLKIKKKIFICELKAKKLLKNAKC